MIEITKPIKFTCSPTCMIAYGRVSTVEQADEGAGLGVQRTAIKREADYRGYDIPEDFWCFDGGFSGKDTNRPALNRAFEIIAAGQARGIIVSKLDRLSRSLLDFATIMAQAQKGKFNVVALDLGLDLSTPTGELMANILATFAQFERRVIGQRTRDGLAEKRAQGVVLGRPVNISEEIAELIVLARIDGKSFRYIADYLNSVGTPTPQGGQCWYPSTVQQAYARVAPESAGIGPSTMDSVTER